MALHNLYLKQPLKTAVDTPRVHHQLLPDHLYYEKALPQVIIANSRMFKMVHFHFFFADKQDASNIKNRVEDETMVPICDPFRFGVKIIMFWVSFFTMNT